MNILYLKTDGPTTYLGLALAGKLVQEVNWESGKDLARDLLSKIASIFEASETKLENIDGIVIYKGPGSFTSLRIGCTVANTLSYSRGVPIVGTSDLHWMSDGMERLKAGENDKIVIPEYGAEPNIAPQKK